MIFLGVMNALVLFLVAICLCLFVVVEYSFFGSSATRIEGDGDGADWGSITGAVELLKTKRSKGIRIRDGRGRTEKDEGALIGREHFFRDLCVALRSLRKNIRWNGFVRNV